jgi:hypothetical protein
MLLFATKRRRRSRYSAPGNYGLASIRTFISGQRFEFARSMNDDRMFGERHQLALAQFPKNAIHVNGAEPERVG